MCPKRGWVGSLQHATFVLPAIPPPTTPPPTPTPITHTQFT